ncbi:integration host factor subunit alpha [Geobacter pelophilus]|uniref:Integration host factor subunit alpha n=1 Tax=Geoanaerobacter pelophilus TaxID=60036 RepID=A0AAW4KYN2_9BACT|nr:integration host factor subunit alpha [Geoanaerobacter pelophilus]MBT0663032.1 integration host factor subunit alpha [Geoanaerobacter pelophilus]
MTKADIVERVAEQCGLTKKDSIDMVESVFSIIKSTLESGEDIKVSGFGKFEVREKHERRGRNPQTGETIIIAARRILSFKPSTILKDAVQGK